VRVELFQRPGTAPLTRFTFAPSSQVVPTDYPALETLAKSVVKDKQKFERLTMTKENLLKMFSVRLLRIAQVAFAELTPVLRTQYNPYKVQFIQSKIPDGTSSTVYRCGPMVDLCRGPHIPHTGRVKALAILKVSIESSEIDRGA
jgi:threonyl-tRNA synthetase